MDKNDRTEMLRAGKISPALRTLTIPAAIGMLVNAIYNVVDTGFIGLLNDTPSIGAAAVLFPIFMLIGAIGLTFGVGSASVISRKLGEGKADEARIVASTAFYTCLIIGVLFAVFGNVFIVDILRLFGATDTIMDRAVIYGRIIIGGSIFQILNMCMNNVIRAEGAASYSSRALVTGGVMNIILDPIFMFVFGMGLAGAAIATITAQMISCLYLLRYFIFKKGILRIRAKDFSFTPAIYSGIMSIGLPTLIRQVLNSAAIGMLNNAAADFGDYAVAAIGITLRVLSLIMMVFFGIGQGLQPLAGYNYGARQFKRVIAACQKAVQWSVVFGTAMVVIFFVFAVRIVSIFSADPMVIQTGALSLRFACVTIPLMGVQNSYASLFQALGKGLQAGVLSAARQGFFFIPAVLILPGFFGLNGVLFSQPLADFLSFVITIPLAVAEMRFLRRMNVESTETV